MVRSAKNVSTTLTISTILANKKGARGGFEKTASTRNLPAVAMNGIVAMIPDVATVSGWANPIWTICIVTYTLCFSTL